MSIDKLFLRLSKLNQCNKFLLENKSNLATLSTNLSPTYSINPTCTSTTKISRFLLDKMEDSKILKNNKTLLDFSSFDFLNLNFKFKKNKLKYLTKFIESNNLLNFRSNNTIKILEIAEQRLAKFLNVDDIIFFPSRLQTFTALLGSIAEDGDVLFYDPKSESPVFDIASLLYLNSIELKEDSSVLEQIQLTNTENFTNTTIKESSLKFIFLESIFLNPNFTIEINKIINHPNYYLLLDLTYSLGSSGLFGEGQQNLFECRKDKLLSFGDLSFSTGINLNFIAGNSSLINTIRTRSRALIFESNLNLFDYYLLPYLLDLIEEDVTARKKLESLKKYFLSKLTNSLLLNAIVPNQLPILVFNFLKEDVFKDFSRLLLEKNIHADLFSYSGMQKKYYQVRFNLCEFHTFDDINMLLDSINLNVLN